MDGRKSNRNVKQCLQKELVTSKWLIETVLRVNIEISSTTFRCIFCLFIEFRQRECNFIYFSFLLLGSISHCAFSVEGSDQ